MHLEFAYVEATASCYLLVLLQHQPAPTHPPTLSLYQRAAAAAAIVSQFGWSTATKLSSIPLVPSCVVVSFLGRLHGRLHSISFYDIEHNWTCCVASERERADRPPHHGHPSDGVVASGCGVKQPFKKELEKKEKKGKERTRVVFFHFFPSLFQTVLLLLWDDHIWTCGKAMQQQTLLAVVDSPSTSPSSSSTRRSRSLAHSLLRLLSSSPSALSFSLPPCLSLSLPTSLE